MENKNASVVIKKAAAILNEIADQITNDEDTHPLGYIFISIDTNTNQLRVDKVYDL